MNTDLAPFLAVIQGSQILNAIIWLVVAALIYFIAMWGVNTINPPEPFKKLLVTLIVLAVVVLLINALLNIAGHGFIAW